MDDVKNLWAELPTLARSAVFVGALLVSLLSGGAVGSAVVSQTDPNPRLDALERNDARQDSALTELRSERRQDRATLSFLACGQEQRIKAESEVVCLRYLTGLRSEP